MTFEPRVKLARQLAEPSPPTAMIDISDGLARDLRNICRQSGVGAVIDAEAIPIHADAGKMENPLRRALCDGEDYELLLTSRIKRPGLQRIGVITAGPGVFLRVGSELKPLEDMGWQHTF
jgi:thiamine-monophosphate kinase